MNIILIGFMASGKSSTGNLLAEKIGFTFTDTDSLIEQKAGLSIKTIFTEKGEPYFRDLETEICQQIQKLDNHVIATGGGVVIRPENRKLLKQAGKVVYLKTTINDVMDRTPDYSTRPLINFPDPAKRRNIIAELLKKREDWYTQIADIVIKTSTGNIDQDVATIITQLKKGQK